jgi:hypothetical protein
MNILYGSQEYRGLLLQLAEEYHLAVSHSCGEIPVLDLYFASSGQKLQSLVNFTERAEHNVYLLIVHPSVSRQGGGKSQLANFSEDTDLFERRTMELAAITSPVFLEALRRKKIRLITYADPMLHSIVD